MYDALLYASNNDLNTIYIELDERCIKDFSDHVSRYKLRSRIELNEPDWHVYAVKNVNDVPSFVDSKLICKDPRISDLGYRVITGKYFNDAALDTYKQLRYQNGVAEGVEEHVPGTFVAQEANFDQLNGIDYRKGCYIGQELTIRTHHKGVIRKRVLPFRFNTICKESIQPLSDLKLNEPSRGNKFISAFHDFGLAMIRLENIGKTFQVTTVNGQNVEIVPYKPSWMI